MYDLSMREVNSICKDNNGFVWASSKTGIIRLTEDSYSFYNLLYEKPNVLTVKLAYQNSILFAFTNNGQIFEHNEIADKFELKINLNTALNRNYLEVSSVLIDENHCFWIGSSTGLYKYQNEQLSTVGTDISRIAKSIWLPNNILFIIKNSCIYTIDTKTEQFTLLATLPKEINSSVSSLYFQEKENKMWLGTLSNGIFLYHFNDKTITQLKIHRLPKEPILDIEPNSDSTLLIAIDGQGIWEIDNIDETILNIYKENANDLFSLRGNGVYDIFCDESQRVWTCTYSGGVSYFKKASPYIDQITHQINNPQSITNNNVNRVIQDKNGRIWLATNNGINCWDKKTNQWKSFYNNKKEQTAVFLTLCEDNQGRIWAGSYSSGVYVLDENTGVELAHYSSKEKNSPIKSEFVFDILKDSDGDIWIGGINTEVICFKTNENRFENYSIQPINVLSELSPNNILFGCVYGLALANKKTKEVRILIDACIVQDLLVKDKIIWVGTSGNGLLRYDTETKRVKSFDSGKGLPSNFINSITYHNGFLWLGTENGLCRFNYTDETALTYPSIPSLSQVSFNRNAHYLLNDGQLAWGTNNGAVLFNPNLIETTPNKGKIFFQNISISGRSIREIPTLVLNQPLDKLEEIKLDFNQNTVSIELLPLGATPGSKFSWKLEGLDKDWNRPSKQSIATYSNIKPEDYTLKVRLYDNSLSRIIAERSLSIKIHPPFWKTWYFYLGLVFLFSALMMLSLWYYVNLLKHQHNEEKVRFFTNTSHDIRTSLTLIKAPIEELSIEPKLTENGQYYLNLAKTQIARLSSVVTQLMDFQKVDIGKGQLILRLIDIVDLINNRCLMFESLAKEKHITLLYKANLNSFISAVDEIMIEKVVDNLISNAIKYSHTNSIVNIHLDCEKSKWSLDVSDQGIGISKKAQKQLFKEFYRGENAINTKIVGSGIGLLLVKNYVNLHGGKVTCTSDENAGSHFQITIPVKAISSEMENIESVSKKPFLAASNEVIQPVSSTKKHNETKAMRVLVVEDNDELRNFLQHAFSVSFGISTAEDGMIAWKYIREQQPDLVVSDVMMPNMDGFELCRTVKSTFETSHIPVILLSALTGKAEQLQGLGLGADDYLTKPFDMHLLQLKIKSIIQNREAVRTKALKFIKTSHYEPILSNELNDKFIKNILEIVHANIANTAFNKDAFASAMNVSPSLLYKKIKLLTNQSPTDFIKTVRLNQALTFLQSKKYNVTEISELCGFTSVPYFSTVFKKHFGKSPTEI